MIRQLLWRCTALALALLALAAPSVRADSNLTDAPGRAAAIPVPLIGIDPDSGTTLGLIGVWLQHATDGSIDRIIAPDVLHNSFFGWGLHGRILAYPSDDTTFTVIAGAKQRVEHQFDVEYQTGITREQLWSFSLSAIDERSGTPRFFGFGNETSLNAQTDYTDEHMLVQGTVGWNISRLWQLAYLVHLRNEDVTVGHLPDLPSIATLFPNTPGLGTHHELLNRLMMVYDSRDNTVIPTRGMQATVYGGLSSRGGVFNDSLYSEYGLDVRGFYSFDARTVLVS